MRKFNKREKILIGSFVVVLVIYVVSTYWITPIIERIDELKKQQFELKVQWEAMKNWVGQEEKLQQHVSDMEAEVNQLVNRIPPAEQSALYWDAINRIASESGVVLTRMVEETAAGGVPAGGGTTGAGGTVTGGEATKGTTTGETTRGGTETGETPAGGTEAGAGVGKATWSVTLAVNGPEAGIMQFLNRLQTMAYVNAVKTGAFAYQDTSVIATFQLVLGSR